jgi:methionyl-tRNA formyltransferase
MSRIVLLAGPGESTMMVAHALSAKFADVVLVQEQPVSRKVLVERRVKRLGAGQVAGQVAFSLSVAPLLKRLSRARRAEILREFNLQTTPFAGMTVHVASVNSDEARAALQRLAPDVIVVNGTRIIGKDTLAAATARFINMHAGITPQYRGVHGGYWALRNGKPDEVGTTIHYVDTGIDTGAIIEQVTFSVTESDNFATYPLLHTAHGLPALLRAVARQLGEAASAEMPTAAKLPNADGKGESVLRYHPTLVDYLRGRILQRIR